MFMLFVGIFVVGNCMMIKFLEFILVMFEVMVWFIWEVYDEDEVVVVIGGLEVGVVFLRFFFDYMLFIGVMLIVKYVMCVVFENFVFVMLELGGKLLVIVFEIVDVDVVGMCIMVGKLLNVG